MATTELLTDSGHSRGDLRMLQTAIKKGWNIPEQLMDALPKVAGAMALNGSPREKLAAMKVLIAMKEQNERAEEVRHVKHTHTLELGPVTAENLAEHKRRLLAEIGD